MWLLPLRFVSFELRLYNTLVLVFSIWGRCSFFFSYEAVFWMPRVPVSGRERMRRCDENPVGPCVKPS